MRTFKTVVMLTATLLLSVKVGHSNACGDLLLKAKDGAYINARSMEFGVPTDSTVIASARNTKFQSETPDGSKGLKWSSKYGYVGIAGLGVDVPLDGLNEKGLSFGALWLPTTIYQDVPTEKNDRALSVDLFGAWILGNFTTVDEVKAALPKVLVWGKMIDEIEMIPPLHFAVHDATGKSLVIEFIQGKPKVYDNPVGVLTNFPTFDWHINNLRNYLQVTAINAPPVDVDGKSFQFFGQGSGMLGIPGDWMPSARFVRLAVFKEFAKPAENASEAVILAQHLFNTVDIPFGTIRERGKDISDYTQWVVIKDLTNKVVYYRTYGNMTLRMVDLKRLDLSPGNEYTSVVMDSPAKPIEVNMKPRG